jgi:hypothetical protein
MRRLILALTLTLTAASTAGAACFNVYLPDLAPPAGVPTGVIAAEFPVAPTTTALFYPFNVLLDTAGHLTVTQEVGVGDPSNARRTWSNVTRVSLVSGSRRGAEYAKTQESGGEDRHEHPDRHGGVWGRPGGVPHAGAYRVVVRPAPG